MVRTVRDAPNPNRIYDRYFVEDGIQGNYKIIGPDVTLYETNKNQAEQIARCLNKALEAGKTQKAREIRNMLDIKPFS